jgi:protein-disulfide isomerase
MAALLSIGLAAGCKAQTTTPQALDRSIELHVRSQFELPSDVDVTLGARKPSEFPGYQTLPVTFSHGTKTQEMDFLISADNTKLIRMDTMDLTKLPGDGINIAGRPIRGNPSAKVTIINFDDLECPYCARMHQELFPSTIDRYKDLVRIIYKDDPIPELHPWATHASVDANCLAQQSGSVYWAYVDYIHGHGQEVTGEDRDPGKSNAALDRIARQEATVAKLDEAQLNACIAKQDETQVRASAKEAEKLGLEGTPELYVNGERINGAIPKDQLWAVIDRALIAAGEKPPPPPAPAPSAQNAPAPPPAASK